MYLKGILLFILLECLIIGPSLCLRKLRERSTATNYFPVSLLSLVSKAFQNLVNKRLVDYLEKCGLLF